MAFCMKCGNKMVNGVCPSCGFSLDKWQTIGNDAVEVEKSANSGQQLFEEGQKYLKGEEVEKDLKKAFGCFLHAAEEKYVPAYMQLAKMFQSGAGVKENSKRANNLIKLAAENGDPEGCLQYAQTFRKPVAIGKKQRFPEYEAWAETAAEKGNVQAYDNIGKYFLWIDSEKCREWYLKDIEIMEPLAKNGDIDAQVHLGMVYAMNYTGEDAFDKALYWFKEAEKTDFEKAQKYMAFLYWNGLAVEKDPDEALRRYEISAEAGDQESLSLLYLRNEELKRWDEVYKWAKILAEKGDRYAANMVATCYRNGWGVDKDPDLSKFWDQDH